MNPLVRLLRRLPGVHPSWATHVAFADGRGTSAEREAHARHLLRCAQCRAVHASLQEVLHHAGALAPAAPPAAAWDRIAARLDAGERVVGTRGSAQSATPDRAEATDALRANRRLGSEGGRARRAGTSTPRPPRAHSARGATARVAAPRPAARSRGRHVVGVCALVAGVLGLLLVPGTPTVYGASSGLQITPRPGTRLVDLRYTNALRCSQCTALVVRVRWRAADDLRMPDEIPAESATTLRARVGAQSDTLVGTLAVPSGAVLGVVALESPDAGWVDDNGGRAWIVAPTGASAENLAWRRALATDLDERDWEAAFRLTQATVAGFPDSVTAWTDLVAHERRLRHDSVTAASHEAAFQRLDVDARRRLATTPDPTGRTAARLFRLAWSVRDVAVTGDTSTLPAPMRFWLGQLHASRVTAPEARRVRLLVELQGLYPQPRAALARLEARWREDSTDYLLVSEGIRTAPRAGDTTAAVGWWRRLGWLRPSTRLVVAQRLSRLGPAREEGIAALRRFVADSGQGDAWRALGETRARFRARQRALVARANLALSEALLARGDSAAGEQALEEAAGGSWSTTALATLAERRLARGDTTRALAALAMLTADPLRAGAFGDTVRARTGRFYAPATVQAWQDSGRVLLRAYLAGHLLPVTPATPLEDVTGVRTERGGAVPIAGRPEPVLLSFWSPGCAPSLEELPTLVPMLARLTSLGLPAMLVARTGPTAAQRRAATAALASPSEGASATASASFLVDADGALHRAVRQRMTPERFLIMPRGGIWRVTLPSAELPVLAAALTRGVMSAAALP